MVICNLPALAEHPTAVLGFKFKTQPAFNLITSKVKARQSVWKTIRVSCERI